MTNDTPSNTPTDTIAAEHIAAENIERYLLRLSLALSDRPESERDDIVAEIRSHIVDRLQDPGRPLAQVIAETLAALGSPELLAQGYQSEGLLQRASASISPVVLLKATLRWAMMGFRGFGFADLSCSGSW